MRIKLNLTTLFIVSVLLFHCAPGSKTEEPPSGKTVSEAAVINNKTVATLDDLGLTNSDFKNYLRSKYSDLKSVLENDTLTSRLFDSFIEHSIILKSSENESITVNDDEINDYSGRNNLYLNDSTKSSIRDILRIEKFLFKKIYSTITVSDYEIQKYYDQNKKDFSQNQRIELSQILLKSNEEAIKVRGNLLNNSTEFEEIARSKSISQESVKNGFMGVFERGDLPKEMETVVFSLPVNQISRVVESEFGFHIFKVSKIHGGKQKYLKDVSEEIEKILFNTKMIYEYTRYMRILRNNINVKIFYENLFFKYSILKGDENAV